MLFVFLCPGNPEGSTGSGSGFKASQKTGQRLLWSTFVFTVPHTLYILFKTTEK